MDAEIKQLNTQAAKYAALVDSVRQEVQKVIVGQGETIHKLLIALLARGHVLIEGIPGLAKTLMVKTLAETLDCDFVRLQFTPDLLPADIIGTKMYNHGDHSFSTIKGPIFTNFVLADEINRAPPKVQSALLEAMQEHQVSIQGETFILREPFLVLATQNPIESEGTYKLPEAQVDRFMFKLLISYPNKNEEKQIIQRFTQGKSITIKKMLSRKQMLELQEFNQRIYADEKIEEYVADLVDSTRNVLENAEVQFGASPRASIWLILAAKAHAMLAGRGYVLPEDIQSVAYDVLRHRILLTYEAEAEERIPEDIIKKILERTKVP